MTTKIKGICKGSFKYISSIFVVKEREMEIGLPTDVKHVAHIGWDGPDGTNPSWMSEFGTGSELTVGSMGSVGGSREQTWTSQDFERTFGRQTSTGTAKLSNFPPTNIPTNPKKPRRKKIKSTSSTPKSSSTRSSRSSKSRFMQGESEEGDSRRNSINL